MTAVRRVVFDTSTLVGAMLQPDSVPYRALAHALALMQVCASPATLDELARVIARRKFDRYQPPEIRREFLALVRAAVRLFDVSEAEETAVNPPCRDPADDKFLALAVVCEADFIVTSDDDLLELHPYGPIPILRPKAFIDVLKEQ